MSDSSITFTPSQPSPIKGEGSRWLGRTLPPPRWGREGVGVRERNAIERVTTF
jgi:hypothetical protein